MGHFIWSTKNRNYIHNPNGGPFLTEQNWNKIIYILFVLVIKLQVLGKYNKEPPQCIYECMNAEVLKIHAWLRSANIWNE